MAELSEKELAELAPCSLEQIRKLIDLGILVPREEDKPFRSSDVHLVRLMTAFDRAGISLDDVARGVVAGELSFRLDLFLPDPVAVSGTYEALAADLGRSPELLRRLSSELGLPPPADDRIRSDDADMLSRIVATLDLVDDDDLSRFARLYGGSMQRLIGSALEFFDRAIRRQIDGLDVSNEEKDMLIDEKGACNRPRQPAGSLAPAPAPGACRPRVLGRNHRGLHGRARNRPSATKTAARDRLPRPHGLHRTDGGSRRRSRSRARSGPREHRP